MKKLAILLTLIFNITYGQIQDFEGIWASVETDYLTNIIVNDSYNEVNILTYSFEQDDRLIEKTLLFNNDSIKTICVNPAIDHKIFVVYKLIGKDSLSAEIKGDWNGTIEYVKLY